MQRADKPPKAYLVVQDLQTVPGFAGGWYINQSEQNSRDKLQPERRHCGASEDVGPACGISRDRVLHRLANWCGELKPLVEPVADSSDQAHGGLLFPTFAA